MSAIEEVLYNSIINNIFGGQILFMILIVIIFLSLIFTFFKLPVILLIIPIFSTILILSPLHQGIRFLAGLTIGIALAYTIYSIVGNR